MKLPTLLNGITLLMRSISALTIPPTPVSAPQNTTVQWINTQGTESVNSTGMDPCADLPLLSRLQCMAIGSPHKEVPVEIVPPPSRQMEEQADQYLFNMTLESFISLRDQRYPSYFFWESDGCSQSPDAPLGFPFLPACYRHDFGYDQYKKVCTVISFSYCVWHNPPSTFQPLSSTTATTSSPTTHDTSPSNANFVCSSKTDSRQKTKANWIETSDQSTCPSSTSS